MGKRDRSPARRHDHSSGRKRDRDRDYHRHDRDDDRRRSMRHRSESDRDRSYRDRDGDRGSRRERDSGRSRTEAGRRKRTRGKAHLILPPLASGCFCYICGKPHWTVECPRLTARPTEYPLMSRKNGCWRCGQRGHPASQCTVRKYRCKQCGGIHDTKDCAFDHVPEEWHEFFDPVMKHVFYARSDDACDVQWLPPSHELDVVLWHCPDCQHLNPNKYKECLVCHAPRRVSLDINELEEGNKKLIQEASSSSSDSDDDEDDDSTSSHSSLSSGPSVH